MKGEAEYGFTDNGDKWGPAPRYRTRLHLPLRIKLVIRDLLV